MAQYFTDFSEYILGAFPSDWTARFDGYNATVIADASFTGGVKLAWPVSVNAINSDLIATWDLIDADPDRGDVEIYWRGKMGRADNDYMQYLVARFDTVSTVLNTYRLGSRDFRTVDIAKFTNGSYSRPAATTSADVSANEMYCQRARLSGTTISVKVWRFSETEPAAWQVTTVDATHSIGAVGLFAYRKSGGFINENDVFSVGTNGDIALTSAPATGPETPINPSITDLLATSARLNWEQG